MEPTDKPEIDQPTGKVNEDPTGSQSATAVAEKPAPPAEPTTAPDPETGEVEVEHDANTSVSLGTGIDQTDDAKPLSEEERKKAEEERQRKDQETLDAIIPKVKPVERSIGQGEDARLYVQKKLSFVGKFQFMGLVGDVVDKALSGPNAMTVGHLFEAPAGMSQGEITLQAFREADTFVQAVAKLINHAPDFLLDCYCIWLQIPDYEQNWAKEIMKLDEEEGGLSDDMGIDMIETFIDQNYASLETFFREKLASVRDHARKARQSSPSAQSTPSKTIPPTTPKQ